MKNLLFRTKLGIAVLAAFALTLSSISNISAVMEEVKGERETIETMYQDPSALPLGPSAKNKEPEYAPGQLIVKLKEGKTLQDIQELNNKYGITQTEKIFPEIRVSANDNAQFISQNMPEYMEKKVNEPFTVRLTMRNTGASTWVKGDGYNLVYSGSQDPNDNTWGMNKVELNDNGAVAPNQEKIFIFTVKAPAKPGMYLFQWKMQKGQGNSFGQSSRTVKVNVIK